MINLIDRDGQWSKSIFSLSKTLREAPRDKTVCQYTIKEEGVSEIRDLTEDMRTAKLDSIVP